MRRVLVLLILLAASPALAQSQPGPLRGTMSAPPPPAAPTAPAYSPMSPAPRSAEAAGQCRLACAQSYYFCLAGEDPADCGTTWGQCRAQCDAPSPAPAYAGSLRG